MQLIYAPRARRSASGSWSGTRTSPSSRPGPTRSTARPFCPRAGARARRRGSTRDEVRDYVRVRRRQEDGGACAGGREDRGLHGPARREPRERRATARLRGRLRADRLRHRRDHGRARARPARLRLRARRSIFRSGRSSGRRTRKSTRPSTYVEHAEGEVLVNSAEFDELPAPEGGRADRREARRQRAAGRFTINYRLRDWGFSRQRYWGCSDPGCVLRRVWDRPVSPRTSSRSVLPEIEDYKPKGAPPLAQADDWVEVSCPRCGGAGQARDRNDGHVRRLGLVLPALLRPRTTTRRRSSVPPSTTGIRSTSTSAASTTRRCT